MSGRRTNTVTTPYSDEIVNEFVLCLAGLPREALEDLLLKHVRLRVKQLCAEAPDNASDWRRLGALIVVETRRRLAEIKAASGDALGTA
jgi:hypothetical protein